MERNCAGGDAPYDHVGGVEMNTAELTPLSNSRTFVGEVIASEILDPVVIAPVNVAPTITA